MLARGLGRTRRAGTRALSSLPETPPLPLFGIGGRYATAIYTAAAKKGELEKVDTDLKVTAARAESGVREAEDARARAARALLALRSAREARGVRELASAHRSCVHALHLRPSQRRSRECRR